MSFDRLFSFAVKPPVSGSTRRGHFGFRFCVLIRVCMIASNIQMKSFLPLSLFRVNDYLFLFLSVLLLGDTCLPVFNFFLFGVFLLCPDHCCLQYDVFSSVSVVAVQSVDLFEVLLSFLSQETQ